MITLHADMVSFVKETQYKSLTKSKGVRRMFKTARSRLQEDLRAYTILIDVVAKCAAKAQGKKIVQEEHVKLAVETLKAFSS